MSEQAVEDVPTIANPDALVAWMDSQGLGDKGAPLEHRYISGGSQNEIYLLKRGDFVGVMRIPPPHAPVDRDKGIFREWRIIEALDGSDVPHTKAIAVCTDQSVLGRTFYLMGFVDGWSPIGLETITDLHKFEPMLKERGYKEQDIDDIFFGNWLRFFGKNLPK